MKKQKLNTAQELIAVEDIKDNILYSLSGYIFSYLWVKAKDANLLEESEKYKHFRNIGIALEGEKQPWQLISVPRVVDTSDLVDHLLKLRRITDNPAKLNLLTEEINALQEMAREGMKEPMIFIKLWAKRSGKNAVAELQKRQNILISKLEEREVQASAFTDTDITYICKVYAELGQHHNKNDDYADITSVPKLKRRKNTTVKQEQEDMLRQEKLNMITPYGAISFKSSKLSIGSMNAKIYATSIYPSTLEYDWAVRIMNCTEAVTCITFNSGNANELADALSKSIKKNNQEARESGDARTQKAFIKAADDADDLISSLDEQGETVGQMSLLVMPFCDDEDNLEETCRRVASHFAVNRIKLRQLGQLQKESFKSLSPYHAPNDIVMTISQRIVPLTTLVGGSPMTVNVLKDDNGFYFATTADGGIISLDLGKRSGDRTNSNFVIMGKPGTGKSTAVKSILLTLYMAGWKIIIIDPEGEYKDLCIKLHGAWLDAGGGAAKSNVFQIRDVPHDDEEETEELFKSNDLPLVNHIKVLEAFLYTYVPSLTDLQKSLLKKAIIELYKRFGIVWDTDITDFKNKDFPIFSDLYVLLCEYAKADAKYEDIAALFEDIAVGSDSFLWNGHTNINVDNDFVCFDTKKLSGADNKIVCAQYFNLLTQSWQLMSQNKTQKTMLVCDEAYLMIDPEVPQSMMYLRNISKRCRKYAGALAIISHSLVDFLHDKVKMYAQALLENPTYKVFFGTDGNNLKETADLYSLSDAEQNVLQAGIRGEALTFIGSSRLKARFKLPKYRLDLMGKGGGE